MNSGPGAPRASTAKRTEKDIKTVKAQGILQNVQKVVYTLCKRLPAAPFSAGTPLSL
jgi:hypothetical protein